MDHLGDTNSHAPQSLRSTRRRTSYLPVLTHDDVIDLCSMYEDRTTPAAEGTSEVVMIDLASPFDDARAEHSMPELFANIGLNNMARERVLGWQPNGAGNGAELGKWLNEADTIDLCTPSKGAEIEKQPESNILLCPICFDSLLGGTEVKTTRCGHIFCSPCITDALKIKPMCPICRKRQIVKNLITLFLDANFLS